MLSYNLRALHPNVVVATVLLLLSSVSSPHGMTVRSSSSSAATPVTVASKCDFEVDLCGWTHDVNHDFEWNRHNYGTPSGHVGTGPSHDHTHGSGNSGYYMYIEASSPRKENDTARLYSPIYSSELSIVGCFEFWYHMYGITSGFLRVYIKPESIPFKNLKPSFELQGNQGNDWKRGLIQLLPMNESFQIIIEGVRGPSYVSDTAIDDLYIMPQYCPLFNDSSTGSFETSTLSFSSANGILNRNSSTSSISTSSILPSSQKSNSDISSTLMTSAMVKSLQTSTTSNYYTEKWITNKSILTSSISYSTSSPNIFFPSTLLTHSITRIVSTESTNLITSPKEETTIEMKNMSTVTINKANTTLEYLPKIITLKPIELLPETSSPITTSISLSSPLTTTKLLSQILPQTTKTILITPFIPSTKPTISSLPLATKKVIIATNKPVKVTNSKYMTSSTTLQTSLTDADNQPLSPDARRGSKETSITPIAVGTTVGIVFIIVMALVGYFIFSKRKVVQGKLDEDSELRYLANDVEYSDLMSVPDPLMA